MALKALIQRLADGPRPAEDSLIVVLPSRAATTAAAGLIARLADETHRLNVVLAAADRAALAPVPARPLIDPRVPHLPALLPARLIVSALRARSVVVVGRPEALPPSLSRLVAGARRRGLPVFLLSPQALTRLEAGETTGPTLVAHSAAARDDLPARTADLAAIAGQLVRSLGIERGDGPVIDALAGLARQALTFAAVRRLLRPFCRRIDTIAQLPAPQTILCLGNGPTSADLRLAGMPHDALFRVNHQWQAQGFLADPDMIFVGVKRSMRAVGRGPLAIATWRKERALLAARLVEFWHGPFSYVVVEQIAAEILPEGTGSLRPTTGAYMIAAAVAMKPARLIVAGMDMFSHAAGAYPGSLTATNAYTPSHDLETDTRFIAGCLAAFEGEIETLSPAFAALARSVPEPRFRMIEGAA